MKAGSTVEMPPTESRSVSRILFRNVEFDTGLRCSGVNPDFPTNFKIKRNRAAMIPLTQGKVALVDNSDFRMLRKWAWSFARGYAFRMEKGKPLSMHRFLMNPPIGMEVDHRDGNPLNNQRSNLRICNDQQQSWNTRKVSRPTTSRFKGVCWSKRSNNWLAKIRANSRQKNLGHFYNEVEAALAYDRAAIHYFGEFARLNFPEGQPLQTHRHLCRCRFCGKTLKNLAGLKNHIGKVHKNEPPLHL